jgi:hypothetical protein
LPRSRVSAPSDIIDSPPRRLWLAGNVELAQICDLAHGHLANVGLWERAVWHWFWLLLLILLLLLIFAPILSMLARRDFPCVLCQLFQRGKPPGWVRGTPSRGPQTVPGTVYKRPDPMIYSQEFLRAHGLAVTWDNPDIWVETIAPGDQPSGVIVPSHDLVADTEYFVVAHIWNGSTDAPAIGLPVHYSFLSFGIGGASNPIGVTHVDLPAKGVAGCPAFAQMKWRTPAKPGHYCLQVRLVWPDDAQPGNNMGQKNTDVKALNSPRAAFTFPVRNDSRARRRHCQGK